MAPSRADPREPLSFPLRSPRVPRLSFRFSVIILLVTALLSSQLGLCAPASSGDDQGSVTWVYPNGGENFHYLDTVNVSYQSSYSEPWLYIFCYANETANTVRMIRSQEVEPHDASVLISMNFSTQTPCWFNLREKTSSNKGLNSQKWTLTDNQRQSGPITTGASVRAAIATTSVSSSSTQTASATPSATASASASSNDDLSAGAKAGLGIGVGIGTSLLCAGLFWLYYRHVKRKEHHQEVYRRIVGGQQGGGAAPAQDAYPTPNEHLEPWRYGGTPQPVPSAVGSAWSGASEQSADWYQNQTTAGQAPYQYYDPVTSSHHVGAQQVGVATGAGAVAAYRHQPAPPSVITTASMVAEPRSPIVRNISIPPPSNEPVPEAAAIRNVQDLSSSLYPIEYNEPVSPVSAVDASIPPTRVASVNYGPNGPRDASTGADFTLLPDYTAPPVGGAGGGQQRGEEQEDDIYGPPSPRTPRSPPPPHSAHAHLAEAGHLPPQPQQQQYVTAQEHHAWHQPGPYNASASNQAAVELPTAQTHQRGYGPQAELPADEVGVQPVLRQQRSDLRGPEQKVLLRDAAPLRNGQHRDGG